MGLGPPLVPAGPASSQTLHLLRSTRDHRGGLAPPRPFPIPPLSPSPPRGLCCHPPPTMALKRIHKVSGRRTVAGSGCWAGQLSRLRPALPAVASAGLAAFSRTQLPAKAPPGGLHTPLPVMAPVEAPGAQPALRPEVPWAAPRSSPASFLGLAWHGVPGPVPGLGLLGTAALEGHCPGMPGGGAGALGGPSGPGREGSSPHLCPFSPHPPTCPGSSQNRLSLGLTPQAGRGSPFFRSTSIP